MSEQIITKQCSKCKEIKAISEFGEYNSSKDKHRYWCRLCERGYTKKYLQTKQGKTTRKRNLQTKKGKQTRKRAGRYYNQSEKGKAATKRYQQNNPEKMKARSTVMIAVKSGKLPKPDSLQCSCGEQAAQYHHHKGYAPEHWLDVIAVCIKCHYEVRRTSI